MLSFLPHNACRAILAAGIFAFSQASIAEVVTLNVNWTSTGTAKATGVLVMDTSYIGTGPATSQISMSDVVSFSMSVKGAVAGNGKFDKSDFSSLIFFSNGLLNYSGQLIGQIQSGNNLPFGSSGGAGANGAFGLIASSATAPGVVGPFDMVTNFNTVPSDMFTVSSIVATPNAALAVPEESTALMFLAGLTVAGFAARRRR